MDPNLQNKIDAGQTSSFVLDRLKTSVREISDFFEIGRPSAYHESVDPNHRIGRYLKSKMSLIDILPCDYTLDLSKSESNENGVTGMMPKIDYSNPIESFRKQCGYYGLDKCDGIRIYTTDDTTVSDSINNQLQDNYLQQTANKLSNFGQHIRQFTQSLGLNQLRESINQKGKNIAEQVADSSGASDDEQSKITELLGSFVDVAASGHKISFPKVWSESNYSPNFQANIRLSSPYGHPSAVKEFIVKPLMYLVLIGSPITNDGVSYGRPYFLTIDAYGLGHTPIGVISNITFRRGGNDTSFNIYRQPLTIDVSLEFEFLVSGFASFSGEGKNNERDIFNTSDSPLDSTRLNKPVSLPTLGSLVRSLRPTDPEHEHHAHTEFSKAHNWGVGEDFSKNTNLTVPSTQFAWDEAVEATIDIANTTREVINRGPSTENGQSASSTDNLNDISTTLI
ncbi:MAG: hypothetical protein ACOC22_03355 [bacterium]